MYFALLAVGPTLDKRKQLSILIFVAFHSFVIGLSKIIKIILHNHNKKIYTSKMDLQSLVVMDF